MPVFSSKSFSVWLTFMSLIHSEVCVCVYGVRECSNFILLHVAIQFSQHHLLVRLSFLYRIFLHSLSQIMYVGLSMGFLYGSIDPFFW